MTPLEHFRRMVASGVINARGEVTRLIGGDAEPEPGPLAVRMVPYPRTVSERRYVSLPDSFCDLHFAFRLSDSAPRLAWHLMPRC